MQGPQSITDSFTADGYYQSASNTQQALTFSYIDGTFALGDLTVKNATPSTTVTWWADQWSRLNALSGGAAPLAFKGFAPSIYKNGHPVANGQVACGDTFAYNSTGGNSAMPPATVPAYMAVGVPSSLTKSGNVISGNLPQVVIVKTNPGYQPQPVYSGTGTIVAQLCP